MAQAASLHPTLRSGGHGAPGIGRDGDEDRLVIAATLNSGGNSGGFRTEPGEHIVIQDARAMDKAQNGLGISAEDVAYTVDGTGAQGVMAASAEAADPLLPDGLDSHRYRCCGNGVVAPVAEFVGERLRVVVERLLTERAA